MGSRIWILKAPLFVFLRCPLALATAEAVETEMTRLFIVLHCPPIQELYHIVVFFFLSPTCILPAVSIRTQSNASSSACFKASRATADESFA